MEFQQKELHFQSQLLKSNLEIEENERKRIARELHDGVGQQISGLKLGIEITNTSQSVSTKRLNEMGLLIDQLLQSVRSINHQRLPVALQRHGLQKAIQNLEEILNSTSQIQFEMQSFGLEDVSLNDNVEIHLYRIVQEIVTNIQKHALATKAVIQFYKQGESAVLSVSDNGVGFDIDQQRSGLGLHNVQNRVDLIGCDFKYESRPGETRFLTILPI